MKRRDRRRSQAEKRQKEFNNTFRLSQKFQEESPKIKKGSLEPLNRRIQKLIESVSGKGEEEKGKEGQIRELEAAQIITPKVLPTGKQRLEEERERIIEEELGDSGFLESLFTESPEDFFNIFEQMKGKTGKSGEGRGKVGGLSVVAEDDESVPDLELSEREKDPMWILEQKVAAKLKMRLERRSTGESEMERLKREGKQYLLRRHAKEEPVLGNKQGSPNSRNRKEVLPESEGDEEENRGSGFRR